MQKTNLKYENMENQLLLPGFPAKEKPAPITQQDRLRFVANNLDKMPELKRILENIKK